MTSAEKLEILKKESKLNSIVDAIHKVEIEMKRLGFTDEHTALNKIRALKKEFNQQIDDLKNGL